MKIGVLLCDLLALELLGGGRQFLSVCGNSFLFRSRLRFHSIWTVKAGAVSVHILLKGIIDVGVVNDGFVHVRHRGVVREVVSIPSPAPIAISGVAITVVNAAVKTDMRAPVTLIKDVRTVVPAPPRRGPKHTDGWGLNPHARHPIIIAVISPVAGSPDVALGRSGRLLYYGQRRRGDVN